MKKYFAIISLSLLLIFVTACSKQTQNSPIAEPSASNTSNQQTNSNDTVKYADLGGTNDIKLNPVDEATNSTSFKAFRDDLFKAVKAKDLKFLKEHIDENIKYTFGINDKLSGFLKEWKLDTDPNNSGFWNELEKVLSHGGKFDDETKLSFTAPYVFSNFPENYDAFLYDAVIHKNVKVYSEPSKNSKILGELNYSIVKVLERNLNPETINGEKVFWTKVQTISGNTGYIMNKYSISPVGYRANFRNINGVWKLVFFVSGD
jgi:biopolymer transport protein ExbD